MKINPLEWSEVNETTFQAEGVLQLRSADPFAIAIETEGVEVVLGAASEHRVPLVGPSRVTLVGGESRVFRRDIPSRVYRMTGEKFTNIDRLPQESGTVAEVTKALRLAKLEQRAMIREIREEHARNKAELAAAKAKAEEVVDDDDGAEAEAAAKAQADADAKAKAEADAKAKAEADAKAKAEAKK